MRIHDFFRKLGWCPAKGTDALWDSTLAYTADNGSTQILTQVWISNPASL
jgi:hypothetical protein